MNKQLIAVIGGSFNPVHNGHIAIGEAVNQALQADKILFIPSYIHPDKGRAHGASPCNRIRMLQLAIKDHPGWEVSDIEYNREETSYTVHTMERLSKIYDNAQLYFVCGADIMYTIHTWRDPYRLFQLCKFAVVQRPGYTTESFLNQVDYVRDQYNGHIDIIECDQVDVSSSDIRYRLCNRLPVEGMLPSLVMEYIEENGLYNICPGDES